MELEQFFSVKTFFSSSDDLDDLKIKILANLTGTFSPLFPTEEKKKLFFPINKVSYT